MNYENLLLIPVKDRLPGLLAEYGPKKVHGLLVVMLTQFCNCFNVIRPMTAEQIVECANEILSSSHEDYLSIEDLSIFFSGAKNGKYGKIYDRLDQQTIFEMMEIYRQERHEKYLSIKEEQNSNLKASGPQFRSSEDVQEIKELFHKANLQYYKGKNESNV